MKTLNKQDIEKRYEGINKKTLCLVEPIVPFVKNGIKFDTRLLITIPGTPISDSRPRHTTNFDTGTSHVYNPHKENLMKIFKEIYNESEELKSMLIISPIIFNIKYYIKIPKDTKKKLNKKELKLLEKEQLFCVFRKDNDNIEKVHFDVLQDLKYQVIHRDEFIVENTTQKLYTEDNERVEVTIDFNRNHPKWMENILYDSEEYFNYSITPKYKIINNIEDDKWMKIFYKNIYNYKKKHTSKKSDKFLRKIESILRKTYNAEYIKYIEDSNVNYDKKIEIILNNVNKLLDKIRKETRNKK